MQLGFLTPAALVRLLPMQLMWSPELILAFLNPGFSSTFGSVGTGHALGMSKIAEERERKY